MAFGDDLLAVQSGLQRDLQQDQPRSGTVVGGTWNPVTSSCVVQIGGTESNADLPDSDDQPDYREVVLAPGNYGAQYGPRGGERVTLAQSTGGLIGHMEHADNDSPQAPTGEVWQLHFSDILPPEGSGVTDGFWKLTNDGVTPGDGKGGAYFGGNADFVSVNCGPAGACWTVSACASQGLCTIEGPNGTTIVLNDNAGTVSLGSDTVAITDGNVRQSDLQAAIDALRSETRTWASANFQNGASSPPPIPEITVTASDHVFSAS
jgi:hypothetical protein